MACCKLYRGRLALKWPDVNDIWGRVALKWSVANYIGQARFKWPTENYIWEGSL
jgi:hypothetical protein